MASLWYLVVTTVLSLIQARIERHYAVRGPSAAGTPLADFFRTALRTHAPRSAIPSTTSGGTP